MDHVVADGKGELYLVEVLSKTMLSKAGLGLKCAQKAAHTLLMLGTAAGPLPWGNDLPDAVSAGRDPRLHLVFVAGVEQAKDLAGLGPVRDQILAKILPWASDFGVEASEVDLLSLGQATKQGLPTAG